METALSQMVQSFGVPTALLLALTLGGWKVINKFVVPLLERLVDSHLRFVASVETSLRETKGDHERIIDALQAQTEVLQQLAAEVAAARRDETRRDTAA